MKRFLVRMVDTWRAVMLDNSTREISIRPDQAGGFCWYDGERRYEGGATRDEAFAAACLGLLNSGGCRELVPAGERPRSELYAAITEMHMVIAAAQANLAARRRLETMAKEGGTLSFVHPEFRLVEETSRRLDELLDAMVSQERKQQ